MRALFTALALLASPAAQAEPPARVATKPALPFRLDAAAHHPDRVILKFAEGSGVRLRQGALAAPDQVAGLDLVAARLGARPLERLFTRAESDLDRERASLLRRVPAGRPQPADLNLYYRVHTTGPADSEALVDDLNGMALIETAYAEPIAVLPASGDIPPATPGFEPNQTYLGPAPLGLGYDACRNLVGARGPDLIVGQLEGAWYYGHEDACQILLGNVVGTPPSSSWDGWRDHGTACVGIINADRNTYGVRGMASGAALLLSSLENGAANMISLSTAAADAGDVFTSSFAFVVNGAHAPADFYQAEFDAVYAAALKGIVYCFSAGNSDQDLANTNIYGNRYVPGAPDSGGVIVGAGNSGDLDKIWFSNYGARVDCHAWGENIATLGYGDLFDPGDVKQRYTAGFGGTSGAAPSVAGIAAAISNTVREQNGAQLSAFAIRDLLRTLGTPQGAGGPIGPRADLKAVLQSQGLPDGLGFTGDAEVNQPLALAVSGDANQDFVLLLAAGRGRLAVALNRDLLLEIATLSLGPFSTFDGSGAATVAGTVPNDPGLAGMSFYAQVADRRANGTKHLTNSVEIWVRG